MCSPRKSDENFLIWTFLWIKTNVAYTRLEVIAKQPSALQVEFITGVKLICYFVHYCFLHWAHPPNMAVNDLDFYYTLYLCIWQMPDDWKGLRCIIRYTKGLFLLQKNKNKKNSQVPPLLARDPHQKIWALWQPHLDEHLYGYVPRR